MWPHLFVLKIHCSTLYYMYPGKQSFYNNISKSSQINFKQVSSETTFANICAISRRIPVDDEAADEASVGNVFFPIENMVLQTRSISVLMVPLRTLKALFMVSLYKDFKLATLLIARTTSLYALILFVERVGVGIGCGCCGCCWWCMYCGCCW